jgi:hypothetical protein
MGALKLQPTPRTVCDRFRLRLPRLRRQPRLLIAPTSASSSKSVSCLNLSLPFGTFVYASFSGSWTRVNSKTCLVNIIPRIPGEIPLLTQPVALDLHLKATLDDRIARQLTK